MTKRILIEDGYPEDSVYHSGKGLLGQPSLIYSVTAAQANQQKYYMVLIGHGHHSGIDGKHYTDLLGVTTALQIVERIVEK